MDGPAYAGDTECESELMEKCLSSDGQPLDTDKLTRQTILQRGSAADERRHAWPDHVRRAVWAILACRTAV